MADASYAVAMFESKMVRALERVRLVLSSEKAPIYASHVHHQYQDKYFLAERLTNTAISSQVNSLSMIGLGPEQLAQLQEWAKTSQVSLQFRSEERCSFIREATRTVEDPTKHVTELSVGGAVRAALTSKVVTTITEFFWKFDVKWELTAYRGVGHDASDRLVLQSRSGTETLITVTKEAPRPEARIPAADHNVNISYMIQQLGAGAIPAFQIRRGAPTCHTPRRNSDIEDAARQFNWFLGWVAEVAVAAGALLAVQPDVTRRPDMAALNVDNLFLPVLPLLESAGRTALESAAAAAAAAGQSEGVLCCLPDQGAQGQLPPAGDANQLLGEEARQLAEKRQGLIASFPGGDTVATAAEAILVAVFTHCTHICQQWEEAINYIEDMLRKQLIDAIGKEVTPADFAEYMRFHNRKLFAEAYAPVPFCFAVRRSDHHSPEGTVSIEEEVVGPGGDSNIAMPIVTMVARSNREHPMHFPLSASTNVVFRGDRYLHAWLSHKFSGQSGQKLTLVSRARQFSSFIVVVGRITSATSMEPKYAMIVQNKDELSIPLDLSTIPTPKEFKDAIESLSPEMQAFAKAYRSMQLESTLFGVLVIQIKPQLEKVLKLDEDSLTKEIKLTQDLMQLFIKYQIPSDLLSFDPKAGGVEMLEATASEKIDAVKAHVKAMQDMIAQAKQEEITERELEAAYANPLRIEQEPMVEARVCERECKTASFSSPDRRKRKDRVREVLDECAPARRMAAPAAPQAMSAPVPAPPAASASAAAPAAPPPPAPTAATPATPGAKAPEDQGPVSGGASGPPLDGLRDYTQVPKEMDESFERLDTESKLRPTIISPGEAWTKRAQKALLASPTTATLGSAEQKTEKDGAFDLLDALTKSGGIHVDHASLHIIVAATHCFDKTVTETVVQDNVNPIDKVERSTLIMAQTIHQQPAAAMIKDAQAARVRNASPMLFLDSL